MKELALSLCLLGFFLLISMSLILVGLRFLSDRKLSKTWTIVALTPSLLSSALFWSLALHMRYALGGWPSGIGFDEFKNPLLFHAQAAFEFFWHLTEYSFYVWPVLCISLAIVPALRKALVYAGMYSAGLTIVTILMLTAPSGFQRWWWD